MDTIPVAVTECAAGAPARWAPPGTLDLVLDELAYGVVVATPAGELLHANHAARHELARHRVLWVQRGYLQVHSQAEGRLLHDALAKAASCRRSLLTLTGADGARLTVAAVPIGRGTGQPEAAPAPVGLLFGRAAVCESLMLCFYARSHALTPTEEHVLGILCQGYSAPQAARRLNVAVSTVRSHVRSLCAKTRSSGVRELVSRVAMLPPVAPALLGEPLH